MRDSTKSESQDFDHIRVIHVDDDSSMLTITKLMLNDLDKHIDVDFFSNVDDALKILEQKKFDVIISDYEMPQKDGLEFLKAIKQKGLTIPFILFTGKGREEVAIQALNLGADGYFNKQGSPETVYGELLHGIKKAVDLSKARKLLNENGERYRKAQEMSKVGNWEIDLQSKQIWGSEEAFQIYGLEKTKYNSLSLPLVQQLVLPEYRSKMDKALQELIANKKEYNEEFKIRRADNAAIKDIHSKAEIVYNDQGIPVQVDGVIQDVTNRKTIEEALRLSEEKHRNLIENAIDIICTHDMQGLITSVNKSVELYGLKKEQVVGKSLLEFITEEYLQTISLNLIDLSKGNHIQGDAEIRLPTGKINVEYKSSPIVQNDKIIGAQTIIRDVTERKKAQEQLLEDQIKLEIVNEKLQVVGSLVRHDVANKLTVAKSYAYLLKKKIKDPEFLKYIEGIDNAINQSSKILEFGRYYEKVGAEEPSYIDITDSFNQAITLLPDIKIEIVNSIVGIKAMADSMLRQLFYNLIDNSLKHGKKVTKIELFYTIKNDKVLITYQDNGVGVPTELKEKIFSNTGNSLGHGLKLVRRMAKAYNWEIREDGIYGNGARFEISIPKAICILSA